MVEVISLSDGSTKEIVKSDRAYPVLLNLLPAGLKGLSFAALTAAIVASLAGKANSISTIFALDIYKKHLNKTATEKQIVNTGKLTIIVSMAIAIVMAPQLSRFDQAFQFIQDFTGLISPGVVAIFLLGLFWKRATALSALIAALTTLPLGIAFNELAPAVPFMNRMGYVFVILAVLMIITSIVKPERVERNTIESPPREMYQTSSVFVIGSLLLLGIIAALYIVFW